MGSRRKTIIWKEYGILKIMQAIEEKHTRGWNNKGDAFQEPFMPIN